MTKAGGHTRSPAKPAADTASARRELSGRAVGSFLWSAASLLGGKLMLLGTTLVLARLLTPADFGLVAAGLSITSFLELALDLGVGAAIVHDQETGLSHRVRIAFTLNLAIATALTGLGVLAAPLVAGFFHTPGAGLLFRVLFCYLLLRGIGQVQDAVLQRDLRFRDRTLIDTTRSVVRGVVSIAWAVAGGGAWAIIGGVIAGEAAAAVAYCVAVRLRPTWRLHRGTVMELLRFGFPVAVLGFVNASSSDSDDLIVGNRLGPRALGYYNVAFRLTDMLIDNVYWIFQRIAYSIYAKASSYGKDAVQGAMLQALRLITLFGFPMGVGLALVAPTAVPLVLSAKWEPAVVPMVLLSLASGLTSIGYASGDLFPAIGKPAALVRLTTVSVALLVAGFWFAAPHGIVAVASVHLAFHLVYGPARLHFANRMVGTTWRQCGRALRPGLATAAGVAAGGLPALLLVTPDLLALFGTIAGGALGAAIALWFLGRDAVVEMSELIRNMLRARRNGQGAAG
jgi:PST family polysaccharide transporter